MRLRWVSLFGPLVTANFGLNCKDNPAYDCSTVDCSHSIKKALCPETCNICTKLNQMTCRDNGNFCDVMDCSHASAKVLCAKSCNLCGGSASSAFGSTSSNSAQKPVQPTQSSVVCVDKNQNCHTNLCGHAFGQYQCPKTCNMACQIKTTRKPYIKPTKPPRTTRPPRVKTTKPPKIAKGIVEASPCQDNPMYATMCGSSFLKCDNTIAKMFCMRTCGMCASIDKMFVCKDQRPDLCQMINCENYLAAQYCAKTCDKCLKPHHMRQSMKPTTKKMMTTRPTTTRRTTTRRTTTRRTTTRRTSKSITTTKATIKAECRDDPAYASICKSPDLDCENLLVTTVCRQSCNVCGGRSQSITTVAPLTRPPITTMRTLVKPIKTKCTNQDVTNLGCDQECKVSDGSPFCVCWTGFSMKNNKCEAEDSNKWITKECESKSSCKLSSNSLQQIHVKIYNPAISYRACYGTRISGTKIVATLSCINRLGTNQVMVSLTRNKAGDSEIVTTHQAKVEHIRASHNLVLISIENAYQAGESSSEQCMTANLQLDAATKCYSVGRGSTRDAIFAKIALINITLTGTSNCNPNEKNEVCAENRVSDLDHGSPVICNLCDDCTGYLYGMVMNVYGEYATVRTMSSILDAFGTFDFEKTTSCDINGTTLKLETTTPGTSTLTNTQIVTAKTSTTSTTTTFKTTTAITTETTTIITTETSTVLSTQSSKATVSTASCCKVLKLISSTTQVQMSQTEEYWNGSPVYHDEISKNYLWLAKYRETKIWIVTPTVGNRVSGVFIGNADSRCPDQVDNWLVFNQRWNAHQTNFECLLKTTEWEPWSPWSPCSLRKCDANETRTRVRLCPSDKNKCQGKSSETESCPTSSCEKVKNTCCKRVETNFDVNGKPAQFEFNRVLDNSVVYSHVDFLDVFLYNVGDHWEIGKGLLQKTVFFKTMTFHADCPTRTGLKWLSADDTEVKNATISCSTLSQGWTEWTSCLELCDAGKTESTRRRTCQMVKDRPDENIVNCGNPNNEIRQCQCSDFAQLIEEDQKCCKTFVLNYGNADFNGVFYKYLVDDRLHYRSKNDYFIFWSQEDFSWVVTYKVMDPKNGALLQLHRSRDCFLDSTQERRKRSDETPYISDQFENGQWKAFSHKQARWLPVETDVLLKCI